MVELERTFLIKNIPDGLKNCEFKEIIDLYIPESDEHPKLRIRKSGEKFEITKKIPLDLNDPSRQKEETIPLLEEEFKVLNKLPGKRIRKLRYYYDYNGRTAEVDVFQDSLLGLVVADFEFKNIEEKNTFEMPGFCLIDVTSEKFIAGGMICGKKYEDIEKYLEKFNYSKLFL